jgi:radical SAM superfamily enzyme YgiQ (UPF0313 family)
MNFALEFIDCKANMPPLGLLTVASLFSPDYRLQLVDVNVEPLTEEHLSWADLACTSSMVVQRDSLQKVVQRCNQAQVPIVAGGPHPTSFHDEMEGVDHFVLDEAEEVLPQFLSDLRNGSAQPMYRSEQKPDVTRAPLPRYDLIRLNDYASMTVQFSRGCPFDCEFCDITKLFGRVPRTKTNEQILSEFDMLYRLGWRGSLFMVDDNFIGNRKEALRLLPAIAEWQKERQYPFNIYTEASLNIVNKESLLDAMVDAGFTMVFLGIETPNPEALWKTKKKQNTKKGEGDFLFNAVRKIQNKGMEVTGGFILGLDGDKEDAFDAQIDFIQAAGIPLAMVGLLTAIKGTDLYARMEREGRLIEETTGNNVSLTLNFVPEMDRQVLLEGYKRVLTTLYDPTLKNYFARCLTLMDHLTKTERSARKVTLNDLRAMLKSFRRQFFSIQGPAYLRFLFNVLKDHPRMFPEAVRLAIEGYHFQRVTQNQIAVYNFRQRLDRELQSFKEAVARRIRSQSSSIGEVRDYAQELFVQVRTEYEAIHEDFQHTVTEALQGFQQSMTSFLDELPEPATT